MDLLLNRDLDLDLLKKSRQKNRGIHFTQVSFYFKKMENIKNDSEKLISRVFPSDFMILKLQYFEKFVRGNDVLR